jgi:hypothetical protein
LVYFVAICYIFPFWYVVRRKIWQPWSCTYYVWPKCVGLRLGRFFHKRIIRSPCSASREEKLFSKIVSYLRSIVSNERQTKP